ncbi:FadR family transcriptional regulator [Actinomadura darangshiensis]|uniref:FadR family transcriptional regulator n=1 Tax=Actinomadura darangshiensis TaxID=705336 RepID=A0A4R5BPN3_9ACTN|nr:FCD domain-containing protein [Actinomadura darangshiensis]TDD88871.1 FadR family transcriptional regulator [Actinomadura darangshiensis]
MEGTRPARIRQPRLADMVASVLRERIVSGELADGELIGPQDDLLAEFGVSKPSMREALRILESEGLITVLRGNKGGAIVHVPRTETAAQAIDLVLRTQQSAPDDIAVALVRLEPLCAGLCAERPDRESGVVPALEAAQRKAEESVDDPLGFVRAAREFHAQLVFCCGNAAMAVAVGALERLWTTAEQEWAGGAAGRGDFPGLDQRSDGVRAHRRLIKLIAAGDAAGAERAARRHLTAAQCHVLEH